MPTPKTSGLGLSPLRSRATCSAVSSETTRAMPSSWTFMGAKMAITRSARERNTRLDVSLKPVGNRSKWLPAARPR